MAEQEYYRLELGVEVTGQRKAEERIKALDQRAQRTKERFENAKKTMAAIDRVKIQPTMQIRDRLTASVTWASQLIKGLDMAQASPLLDARDRVSSVVTHISSLLEAVDNRNVVAVADLKGTLADEITKAKASLTALNDVKTGPVAELRGELFGQLTKAQAQLRQVDSWMVQPEATLRDRVTARARTISNTLGAIVRRPYEVVIRARDMTANIFSRISRTLFSLQGMAAVALGAFGAGKLTQATVGAAMTWETQAVSMEHWLKGNKALAKEVTGWLEQFAAATPFEMEDLFPAMTRAIGIAEGDIRMSERMVKLAADMAGLTPGKTVRDAMEALADAQMGEFERMKEFHWRLEGISE